LAQNAGRNTHAELFSCPYEGTQKERVMTHERQHAAQVMTSSLGYTNWVREFASRSNEKTLSQQIYTQQLSQKTGGYCWPTYIKVLGVLFLGEVSSAFLPSTLQLQGQSQKTVSQINVSFLHSW
jgi:hypothetical protein